MIKNNSMPSNICKAHFDLLLSLTSIHSEKIKKALEAYVVDGMDKKRACEMFGVNSSYFSLKIRLLQDVNRTVISMYPFYRDLFAVKCE